MTPVWDAGRPQECAKCGADLRLLSPIYTVRNKPKVAWCSRLCRSSETGEKVRMPIPDTEKPAPASKVQKSTLPKASASKPAPKSGTPKTQASSPKPPKAERPPKQSGSLDPSKKLYRTKVPPPNMAGKRKQIFEMMRDGMKVQDLFDKCNKLGLDGKGNLRVLALHYGLWELR